jgi:hypothetical protein
MLAPECLRQQSLRHYVQVESRQRPFWIGTIDICMPWAAVKAITSLAQGAGRGCSGCGITSADSDAVASRGGGPSGAMMLTG